MSRIGKKPIPIPSGVEVTIREHLMMVRGPKGALTKTLHPHVTVTTEEAEGAKQLVFTVADPTFVRDRALWGLFRTLTANMIAGVTTGFEKKLEVIGVGYKVNGSANTLTVDVGYSHPVEVKLPSGITATIEKNVITLQGMDKELLGETAASVRRIREPEPYKGKGIKYSTETIRRKAGKSAKAGGK